MCNLLSVGKLRDRGSITYDADGARLALADTDTTIEFERLPGSNVFGVSLARPDRAMTALDPGTKMDLGKGHGLFGHCGLADTSQLCVTGDSRQRETTSSVLVVLRPRANRRV